MNPLEIIAGVSKAIYDAAKSTVNSALKSSENAVGEMKDIASDLHYSLHNDIFEILSIKQHKTVTKKGV